jgi:hypothetical protein
MRCEAHLSVVVAPRVRNRLVSRMPCPRLVHLDGFFVGDDVPDELSPFWSAEVVTVRFNDGIGGRGGVQQGEAHVRHVLLQ